VKARLAAADDIARWDDLVAATGRAHILQSSAWGEIKAATGWAARRYLLDENGGRRGVAQVLVRTLPLGITVAYAPRAPLVEPRDLARAIAALRDALTGERCASLLCDPEVPRDESLLNDLRAQGVRRSPVFVQPRRTLLMDLTKSDDELFGAMKKKTRQYVHKAERAGVVTEETKDLDRYLAVLRTVSEREHFGIHSREYFVKLLAAFGDRAHMLMARVGDEDCGALLVARLADRAWELYGGWSGAHTEARPFYLLKWRSMMRMRALGATRYDMWGLAEGADDPLAGVENFKLGFGGEIAEWIGALETPVHAALYPLWQIAGRRRLARSAA
jgi:lipid II:glycine glycyltransferase (peptidoglycan interpeptide bridge formation enzyme)